MYCFEILLTIYDEQVQDHSRRKGCGAQVAGRAILQSEEVHIRPAIGTVNEAGKNIRWTIDSRWNGKGEGGSHRGIFKILNLNWKVVYHKRLLHDSILEIIGHS